jgi:hypothetical protein
MKTKPRAVHEPQLTEEQAHDPVRARSLFEIGDDLQALEDLLLERGGDVTDEDAERILDEWLKREGEAEADKVDRYVALIRTMLSRSANRLHEAQRITERAKIDEREADRLKDRLIAYMQLMGRKTIEGLRFRTTLAGNGGKKRLTIVDGTKPEDVPLVYRMVNVRIAAPSPMLRQLLDELLEKHAGAAEVITTINESSVRSTLEAHEAAVKDAEAAEQEPPKSPIPWAHLEDRGVHLKIS